jgi:uncharacterized membrane protein
MLQETHDKLRPHLAKRDHGFRWRGHEVSRVEGLSDAVFAFAITLLVVSLEVPKTFGELREMMRGFVAFSICFALLLMMWHAQYIYFRRYALDDRRTFLLNAALLFVVAFYIYPLKFLFSTLIDGLTGFQAMNDGVPVPRMNIEEWSQLMLIYGAGYVGVYVIFALLYLHAYRLRDALELSPMEVYETRGVVQEHLVMIGIGALSIGLALMRRPTLSGMIYMLIGPIQTMLGMRHGKRRRALMATPAYSPIAESREPSAAPQAH